jgi:hypothetical protein
MSRNFELMTQLGLEVGAIDEPKPNAAPPAGAPRAIPMQSNDVADANEEEMARFLLEMYPGGGGGAKE